MNMIYPNELMSILHSPYPEATREHLRWGSLDMLRALYQENPDRPEVREARTAMKAAASEWNNDQVADFLLNFLFEPPLSTDLQTKSPSELRQILVDIYNYLFLDR